MRLREDRTWVHFLHVGKTGGTAVKTALRKTDPGYEPGYGVRTPSHRVFLHEHKTTLSDVPQGEKFFFFLRDPIDRFVSGFYSRKREGKPRYYFPWTDAEEEAFRRYPTPNELALALSSDDPDERRSAAEAMQSIQHVGDTYSRWYESEEYFLSRLSDALLVGRAERLDEHFTRLRMSLNLSSEAALPDSNKKAHKNPYSELDTHLDGEARRNLEKWYSEDYAFLELCDQHADQLR
jgi:hypothetical protein